MRAIELAPSCCTTYRKGQEYYTQKHSVVTALVDSVSVSSFRVLREGYARDTTRFCFEGLRVPVRHLATFEVLRDGFQRDDVTAYDERQLIAGIDGRTFEVLSAGYSRDAASVFFTNYRAADPAELGRTWKVAAVSRRVLRCVFRCVFR